MTKEISERERIFNEEIQPLLEKAFTIAVDNGMALVWSTAYDRNGENYLLHTLMSVIPGKAPKVFFGVCSDLGILPNILRENNT